jgi:putative SOS response-associated peptidase YedK
LPARYVIERGGQVDLLPMLIPSWWQKTAKEVPATFNARAETFAVTRNVLWRIPAQSLLDTGVRLL